MIHEFEAHGSGCAAFPEGPSALIRWRHGPQRLSASGTPPAPRPAVRQRRPKIRARMMIGAIGGRSMWSEAQRNSRAFTVTLDNRQDISE